MTKHPKIGIAYFPTEGHRRVYQKAAPSIEAIEWTVDAGWSMPLSDKDLQILDQHADNKSLSGHGVHYSVLSAGRDDLRQDWLAHLKRDRWKEKYLHFSVHFGFSTGKNFDECAPLPVPYTKEALDVGRRNLEPLTKILNCPIGLENLALAFTRKDVEEQGQFLEHLLAPFDGFLLLDLHNIFCQSHNFQVDYFDLITSYPLQHVREIHISGGSWNNDIRRDTHDHAVPEEIYKVLPKVIPLCPHLECIFMEQVPGAAKSDVEQDQILQDFLKLTTLE